MESTVGYVLGDALAGVVKFMVFKYTVFVDCVVNDDMSGTVLCTVVRMVL